MDSNNDDDETDDKFNWLNRPFTPFTPINADKTTDTDTTTSDESTTSSNLTDPFSDIHAVQVDDAASQKRKYEEEVDSIDDGVKRMRCGDARRTSTWDKMEEHDWNERSGKLHGKWIFLPGGKILFPMTRKGEYGVL